MTRKKKITLGAVGGVIILLAVAVYVLSLSYNYNYLKPLITRAAFNATGRQLTIRGDINLDIGLTPALVLREIAFQNASWGSRPDLASIKRLEVKLALLPLIKGNLEIKRLNMLAPDILVETNAQGRSNLEFQPAGSSAPEQKEGRGSSQEITSLPGLSVAQLQVEQGNIAFRKGQSAAPFRVRLERLTLDAASQTSPMKIQLKGMLNQQPFQISGSLGSMDTMMNPEKTWPVDLSAKLAGAVVKLKGSINDIKSLKGLNLGFNVRADDLKKAAAILGKPLPVDGPLQLSGQAKDTGAKSFNISNMKLALADSDLSGSVAIDLSKKPTGLNAVLTSKRLDLRPFLDRKDKGEREVRPADKAKAKGKKEKLIPDSPLALGALKYAQGSAKLNAAQVLMPKVVVDNLSADIILKENEITVQPLTASIGPARLNGQVNLRSTADGIAISTDLKFDDFDLGRFLKEFKISDMLEGNMNADFKLTGQGSSVANLVGGLNGQTSLVVKDGRIQQKRLELLGGDLGANILRLVNPFKGKEDFTALDCLVSSFDIKDGIAESSALVIDTPRISVVGSGNINLKTEALNISLNPIPKQGLGIPGLGRLGLSLRGFARAFKLSGTLAQPSLGIDPTQTILTIGKAVGGVALFGPAGIAAALLSGSLAKENRCLAAIEAAKKGVKPSAE